MTALTTGVMKTEERSHLNGEPNWRDEAMNEALHGFGYGENLDALLRAVRRAQPNLVTKVVWPDRIAALKFLRGQAEMQPLLAASCDWIDDDESTPYIAWYGLDWQGAAVEVAFSPGCSGEVLCMGPDETKLESFITALLEWTLKPSGRCLRYSKGWESAPDMDREIGKVTWDDIVLPDAVIERMRQAIEGFFACRPAMRDFGFAWRRGVLLVGPPGTGKTMVCKAAAAALPNLPFLYVRDLREAKKKDSIKAIFERARKLAPCLLAFEDIDGFLDDDNRTVFLNEMDGFANNDGLLVIASSNHPGKIDEALLTRPSRFDRVFHLGLPAHDERRTFCRRALQRSSLSERLSPNLNVDELAEQVAAKSDGFTPAYLKEAFVAAALERAQDGAHELDEAFGVAVIAQVEELRAHLKLMKKRDALSEMRSLDDIVGFRR